MCDEMRVEIDACPEGVALKPKFSAAVLWLTLLVVLAAQSVAYADDDTDRLPASILVAHGSGADDSSLTTGTRVLGLYRVDGEDSYLRWVPVVLKMVPDPHYTGDSNTVPLVSQAEVTGEDKPLLSLYGKHGLTERIVATVTDRQTRIEMKRPLTYRLGGQSYRFTYEPVPNANKYDPQFRLVLRRGRMKHEFTPSYVNDITEFDEVVWAGDLDGDGKLDVILGSQGEKGEGDWVLYLSRGAPRGKLLRPVAKAWFSCGC